jgi:hypothetical protein
VRCSLARADGDGTVRSMRELLILAIDLLVTIAKLLRPGGVQAVAAESLLLKHQLLISNRSRQRAPNLTTLDRFLIALTTLFVSPRRIPKLGPLIKPGTLFTVSSTRHWSIANIVCSFPPATVATNPAPKVPRQNSSQRSLS